MVILPQGSQLFLQLPGGKLAALQLLFQLGLTRVVLLDAAGDFLKLLKNRRDVLSGLFERGNFLVFCVLARLLLLIVGDERAAGTVERDGLVHQRRIIGAARGKPLLYRLRILPDVFDVEHFNRPFPNL